MHTDLIKLDRGEALKLYRKYREHANYSVPIDQEIQRAYQVIAQGKMVLRALESIKQAGLNREFLPKLALAPATATSTHCRRYDDGRLVFEHNQNFYSTKAIRFEASTFVFPAESFPISTWNKSQRVSQPEHKAMVPIIPIHLRPKRGLANYHILFEAEWSRAVPVDPMLLRRIGKADLWVVVAAWELSKIERAALATRV